MNAIFSLTDNGLFLEFETDDPEAVHRRVVTVQTVRGGESRDFGLDLSGSRIEIETDLSADDARTLGDAVRIGGLFGISFSNTALSVYVDSFRSVRKNFESYSVKLTMSAVGEL
jgi:hypothetical protein